MIGLHICKDADGNRMRGMQMHDGPRRFSGAIDALMKERLLGRLVAGQMRASGTEMRQARRVKIAHRDICGSGQDAAVAEAHADIAGRPKSEAAIEDRFADLGDGVTLPGFFG